MKRGWEINVVVWSEGGVMDNALGSPFAYMLYDGMQIFRYVGDEEG